MSVPDSSTRCSKRKQIFTVKSADAELSFEETSANSRLGNSLPNGTENSSNNNNASYGIVNIPAPPSSVLGDREINVDYSLQSNVGDEDLGSRQKPTKSHSHGVSLFNTMKEELAEFVGGLLRERESPVNLVEAASTYDEDSYEYSDSLYSSYSSTSTFTQDQPVGFYQPVNRGTHQDSATSKLTQDDAYYDDAVVHVVVPVSAADAGLVNDYENPHKAVFHHCTAVVDDQDYQPIAEKIRALSPFPPASQSEDMIAQENVPPIDDQSSDSHNALRATKRRTLSLRSANKPLSPVTDIDNHDIKDEIQDAIYCSESHSGMEDMDDMYIAKKARHPCKNDEHNAKERVRRARIKHSADVLKELIPGCTMKTDKASVFEQAVNYVIFMQGKVSPKMKGKVHQEFIAKYIRSGGMEEEDSS